MLAFMVTPLVTKGRWFLWCLAFLWAMMAGNAFTAWRMEIPDTASVQRVSGTFVVLFPTGIRDAKGVGLPVALLVFLIARLVIDVRAGTAPDDERPSS